MMTVHEVAEHYGVSDAFMVRALGKIGFKSADPDTGVPTQTVARFEEAFGDRVREARPKPPPSFTAETDAVPTAACAARQPKPHVMRVAHASVTGKRDRSGTRVKALLDDPGRVHAIDAAGTWDGDPWRGEVVPGAVHFFGGPVNSGPFAACGTTNVRAVLGDEFEPADPGVKTAAEGQCPKCAELVADGEGFRTPPHEREYRSYFCEAYLRLRIEGRVEVQDCSLAQYRGWPSSLNGSSRLLRSQVLRPTLAERSANGCARLLSQSARGPAVLAEQVAVVTMGVRIPAGWCVSGSP